MRINDEALNGFIQLYKEEFGEEIDRAQASEMAFRLITLYERLARKSEHVLTQLDDQSRQSIGFQT